LIISKKTVDLQTLTLTHAWLGSLYAQKILSTLEEWKISTQDIDCIAVHGQTIYHAPVRLHQQNQFPNATLQIIEADHLAVKTGIITISDFRQKHIAVGGEGAPLVVYGDYLLCSNKNQNRILLNIGGIANFTYLPASLDANAVFATDTGPGNCLMDYCIQKITSDYNYDPEGIYASQGVVDQKILEELYRHPFLDQDIPKSTGLEMFNGVWLEKILQELNCPLNFANLNNILATLCYFTAKTIADIISKNTPRQSTIYISGGGKHNQTLIKFLTDLLSDYDFQDINDLGISVDAKEAILFALLANESLYGEGIAIGKIPKVCMGKISFPY